MTKTKQIILSLIVGSIAGLVLGFCLNSEAEESNGSESLFAIEINHKGYIYEGK